MVYFQYKKNKINYNIFKEKLREETSIEPWLARPKMQYKILIKRTGFKYNIFCHRLNVYVYTAYKNISSHTLNVFFIFLTAEHLNRK